MVKLMVLAAAASVGALPLAELPPQPLATGQCAMFLWDRPSGKRIAMITAAPLGQITVIHGGRSISLPASSAEGPAVMGFAPRSQYRSASIGISLDLAIAPTGTGGAIIRDGALTLTEADGSAIVAPVAGLIGCQ
jgi:hypothetical protein